MADIECNFSTRHGIHRDNNGSTQSLLLSICEESSTDSYCEEEEDIISSSSTTFVSDLSNDNDNDSVVLLHDEVKTSNNIVTNATQPPRKFFVSNSSGTEAAVWNNVPDGLKSNKRKKLRLDITLEKEKLIAQWREEFEAELKASKWYNPVYQLVGLMFATMERYSKRVRVEAEICIGNLPLTTGAIALSWVTMGNVWFNAVEEFFCSPINFWSTPCLYHESPGCYNCNSSEIGSKALQIAHNFRGICSSLAIVLIIAVVAKFVLAWKIVQDDLSNPVTSTPFGAIAMGANALLCKHQGLLSVTLTMCCSFAQVTLYLWFLSMVMRYRMLPDPSWSPNTISGLCVAATNIRFHVPIMSYVLFALVVASFLIYYPISLLRVFFNKKISANICWIQVSAPSSMLSALAFLVLSPYKQMSNLGYTTNSIDQILEQKLGGYWLPMFHTVFFLCLIGALSSIYGLVSRWETFRKVEFSPAHAAFCFPILCHVNAVHSYWYIVNRFSTTYNTVALLRMILCSYWVIVLVTGTITTLLVTAIYLHCLPKWTRPTEILEEEPLPLLNPETVLSDVMCSVDAAMESLVSPAVLQANESGVLVRVRRDTEDNGCAYVRTCQMTSIGFEPTLSPSEVMYEREELLKWVASHAPQPRHSRMMSNPDGFLKAEQVIYGTFGKRERPGTNHKRFLTQL